MSAPSYYDPIFYLTWAEHPDIRSIGWVLIEMELERKFREAMQKYAPPEIPDLGSISALGLEPVVWMEEFNNAPNYYGPDTDRPDFEYWPLPEWANPGIHTDWKDRALWFIETIADHS